MNRNKFIITAAVPASGTTVSALPIQKEAEKKLLVHHVFFWLKDPGSTRDRDQLIEGIKTLGKIETIRKLQVGIPASTEKRDVVDNSWQVSEMMFFDDEADQKTYQDHPIHQAFVKNYSHLWAKVLVYDVIEV